MNPQFLKALSVYPVSPMSVTDYAQGILHPRSEILALLPVIKPFGKSTAAAFAIADSDIDTITSAIVAKVRASWMGIGDAVNAVPDIVRDVAQYGLGADYAQMFAALRNGASVPAVGGSAITFPIPLAIPLANVQKENPNLNAYSGGQLYAQARVDLDVVGTALPFTVVLVNGSLNITAITAELWAVTGCIRPLLWMAPAQKLIVRAATSQTIESEGGPLFDEIVFASVDAATFPNSNDNIQITLDGKNYLFQTPTMNIPGGFSGTVQANVLPIPSYDMAQNTKARASASRVGRTPFIWIGGIESPVEGEYPVAAGGRAINFGAKCTSAPTLAFWRETPITSQENLQFLATMMQDPRLQPYFAEVPLTADQITAIKALPFGRLAVYGGGSTGPGSLNGDLSIFKARQFAPAMGR